MDLSSETQIGYDAQTLRDPFLEKSKAGISGSHSRSRVTCDVWHRSSMLNCGLYTDDVTALKRLMQVAGGGGGSSYGSSDAYYNGQPVTMHTGLSTLQCGPTGTGRVVTRPSFLPPSIFKDEIIIHVLIVLSIDTTSFLGHLLTFLSTATLMLRSHFKRPALAYTGGAHGGRNSRGYPAGYDGLGGKGMRHSSGDGAG